MARPTLWQWVLQKNLGSKDGLCPLDRLSTVQKEIKSVNALHVIDGGDHAFKIGKKHLQSSGSSQEEAPVNKLSRLLQNSSPKQSKSKINRFSLLKLQGREKIYGHQLGRRAPTQAHFHISGGSPPKARPVPGDTITRSTARPVFGTGPSTPSMTLRNLILSPMKPPQLSRNCPDMFTF